MPLPPAIAFVDLETTGANPEKDRITEVAIVEVREDGVRRWSSLVNPKAPIPPFIQKLTGITPEMVASAPSFGQIAREVLERLQGRVFAAHNARFDYSFLRAAMKREGLEFCAPTLCTVKLSRKLFPSHHKHNLDALVERHGFVVEGGRHRALGDADVLCQFWQLARESVAAETLEALVAGLTAGPSLPAGLDAASLEDLPDAPGVYVLYGEEEAPLLVGRDLKLRKKVLSLFDTGKKIGKELAEQVRKVEWQQTAGELGAALLEARLARRLAPRFNRQKPVAHLSWALHSVEMGGFLPRLTAAEDLAQEGQAMYFGLFASEREARAALLRLVRAHRLCPSLLGLQPGRIGCAPGEDCRGACVGRESLATHGARLLAALSKLRLAPWPWNGPVALVETDAWSGRRDVHVVDAWRWLGSAESDEDIHSLLEGAAGVPFEAEEYRILEKAVKKGGLEIRRL